MWDCQSHRFWLKDEAPSNMLAKEDEKSTLHVLVQIKILGERLTPWTLPMPSSLPDILVKRHGIFEHGSEIKHAKNVPTGC